MSLKDRLDDVIKAFPVDETARRVTSKGISYESPKKMTEPIWEGPQAMERVSPLIEDLTGRTWGKMTVIGRLRDPQTGAKWLVRCLCGKYTARTGKSIRRAHRLDCCQPCKHLQDLKHMEYWKSTGYNHPDSEGRE